MSAPDCDVRHATEYTGFHSAAYDLGRYTRVVGIPGVVRYLCEACALGRLSPRWRERMRITAAFGKRVAGEERWTRIAARATPALDVERFGASVQAGMTQRLIAGATDQTYTPTEVATMLADVLDEQVARATPALDEAAGYVPDPVARSVNDSESIARSRRTNAARLHGFSAAGITDRRPRRNLSPEGPGSSRTEREQAF